MSSKNYLYNMSFKRNVYQCLSQITLITTLLILICISLRTTSMIKKYTYEQEHIIEKYDNDSDLLKNNYDMISYYTKRNYIINLVVITLIIIYVFFTNKKDYLDKKYITYQMNVFEMISNNTENVFIIRDYEEKNYQYVSDNATKLLGVTAKDLIESSYLFYSHIVAEDRIKLNEFEKNLNNFDTSSSISFKYLHPITGTIRNIVLKAYFIYSPGRIPQYIYMLDDITHMMTAYSNLQHTLLAAQSANDAKTQFLSNMSHDIRTPMHAIIGMTALAQMNINNTEKVLEFLGKIEISSKHLLNLINEVLDMSKIESGNIHLNIERINISELIDTLSVILKPRFEATKIKFIVNKEYTNQYVEGDLLRITQILLNIIDNAIKYTPSDGQVIFTIKEELKRNTSKYVFEISDNGFGIKSTFLERIFDPFEREHNSTTGRIEGTGLGMAITKSIVDMMDGVITIESKVGRGTTVNVMLNLKTINDEKEKTVRSNNTCMPTDKNVSINNLRALVVDDQDINLCIAEGFLNKMNIDVISASSADEALDYYMVNDDFYFDMIFMDIQMPNMNGYEATKKIRSADKLDSDIIPIIAMTADAFANDVQKSKNAGMDHHIAKPFQLCELENLVRKVISK